MRGLVCGGIALLAVSGAFAQPGGDAPTVGLPSVGKSEIQPGDVPNGTLGPTATFPGEVSTTDDLAKVFGSKKDWAAEIGEQTGKPGSQKPDVGTGTGDPVNKFLACVEAYVKVGLTRDVATVRCGGAPGTE